MTEDIKTKKGILNEMGVLLTRQRKILDTLELSSLKRKQEILNEKDLLIEYDIHKRDYKRLKIRFEDNDFKKLLIKWFYK